MAIKLASLPTFTITFNGSLYKDSQEMNSVSNWENSHGLVLIPFTNNLRYWTGIYQIVNLLPKPIYLKEYQNDATLFYLEVLNLMLVNLQHHEHSTFQGERKCQSIASLNKDSHHSRHSRSVNSRFSFDTTFLSFMSNIFYFTSWHFLKAPFKSLLT